MILRSLCSQLPRRAIKLSLYPGRLTSRRAMRMSSTLPTLPIFEAIAAHDPESTCVVHSNSGRKFKYGRLLGDVAGLKDRLFKAAGRRDLNGARVAFLVENSYDYVVTLLAILAAKSIAVPLSTGFPTPELQYILENSEASVLLSSEKFHSKAAEALDTLKQAKLSTLSLQELGEATAPDETVELVKENFDGAGMMLYTSGTTNRPKGVVLPQAVMTAQARSLLTAWEYSPSDYLLHVLPLHHIHGIINALFTPLFAGSTIEFLFPFNATAVWQRLAAPFLNSETTTGRHMEKVTFFTAVPTVYSRLLASHKTLSPDVRKAAREAISPNNLRLCISGSAALPTPTKRAWTELSNGNVLLERYGMTEVGMALSCGLDVADRVDGSVGWPLPGVEARLVDVTTGEVIEPGSELDADGRERDGEIQLRGPTIFTEYWRNPEATAKEFVDAPDGKGRWFKTGDVAVRRTVHDAGRSSRESQKHWANGPLYFIRGRASVDIIKSGGEKVSALEVERELLSLPHVTEAAVIGIQSGTWGQKVAAVVIIDKEQLSDGKWTALDMRRALKGRLANYKIPQIMKVVDHIPRNAMGKINKKALTQELFGDDVSGDET